jgi:hypothetical protein
MERKKRQKETEKGRLRDQERQREIWTDRQVESVREGDRN